MKRLNPETGKPFVRGDTRADGFLFGYYIKTIIRKTGYFAEHWLSESAFNNHNVSRNKSVRCWASTNKGVVNAKTAKRHAAKLKRTPPWLSDNQMDEIADFYVIAQMFKTYTGREYHVDHIIPLQGETVSGLHVPWNLQVIEAADNKRKSNRLL